MLNATGFLVSMMSTPDNKLAKADPVKLAVKYRVNPEWVEMSLKHWQARGR